MTPTFPLGPFCFDHNFAKRVFVKTHFRPLMHQHTCRLQKIISSLLHKRSDAAPFLSSTSAILLISPQKATHHWASAVHRQCVTLRRGARGHNGDFKALPDHKANRPQYVIVCRDGLQSGGESARCTSLSNPGEGAVGFQVKEVQRGFILADRR